jgi:O-methyltransferase involved in polyketide biosynthesis
VRKVSGGELGRVGETALATLRNRAVEAVHPRSAFADPEAVRLYASIDDDTEDDFARFGPHSQTQALRALAMDRALRAYLATHPGATVVALGEGLQTSYWRLGRPAVDWLTVDVAPVVDLRARLLPAEPRVRSLATSVLDRSWLDAVDPGRGVFVTAEGLFMYLARAEVLSLIADCADRFPGGQLIFDSIPAWFSARTMAGNRLSDRYTTPPMPFSLSVSQARRLPAEIDGVVSAVDVQPALGRGLWRLRALRALANLPPLRDRRPSITLLTFAR